MNLLYIWTFALIFIGQVDLHSCIYFSFRINVVIENWCKTTKIGTFTFFHYEVLLKQFRLSAMLHVTYSPFLVDLVLRPPAQCPGTLKQIKFLHVSPFPRSLVCSRQTAFFNAALNDNHMAAIDKLLPSSLVVVTITHLQSSNYFLQCCL